MANANYLSVADVQTIYCSDMDLSSYSASTISGMISAASRLVDNYTNANSGWDFEVVTGQVYDSDVNCHTDADGNLVVNLIKRPLFSLASVTDMTITLAPYSTSLVLTSGSTLLYHSPNPGWQVIYPNSALITVGTLLGALRLASLRSYRYMLSISYSGGYMTIPEDIRYATSLYFRSIVAKRYNQAGAFSMRQGSMGMDFSARGSKFVYSPFVEEAQAILGSYVRVT